MQKPRICVILVNWNGKSDTIECLDSLARVEYSRFTSLVVDNGSSDDSVNAIRAAHPEVPILQTGENLGFAGGNNAALKWALSKPFEWFLLLNNDTVVAPDLLRALLAQATQTPDAKIFGAKLLRYHDRERIDHLGGRWNPNVVEFDSLHAGELDGDQESESVDYVCGAALFMHRSVPETIGLLEARFFLFWEETDFCFRARRVGFAVRTAPNARVWHKVSASFIGGKPHTHYFWWRSRLLWLERNVPLGERTLLLREIVRPELWKTARHYLLKSLQHKLAWLLRRPHDPALRQKIKRLKSGLAGAFDYYRGRFGNCPKWVARK